MLMLMLLKRRVASRGNLEVAHVELHALATLADKLATSDAFVVGGVGLVRLERNILPLKLSPARAGSPSSDRRR